MNRRRPGDCTCRRAADIGGAGRGLPLSLLSIKQIAALLGFEDEACFGRFFKKHTGHRPTEFRAMARRHLATV